jgi:hypothetical protein
MTILSVIGTVLAIVLWILNRQRPPTKEEKVQAIEENKSDTLEAVRRLRDAGNNKDADEMLHRIRANAATGWVQNNRTSLL